MIYSNQTSGQKIATARTLLDTVTSTGATRLSMAVGGDWWLTFMFVLGVTHVSIGTYADGRRFAQPKLSPTYNGVHVSISTDEVPEAVPVDADESFIALGFCPDCGDLSAVLSNDLETAKATALAYGMLT